MFKGLCVNCHEETYIEDQYHELDMAIPKGIAEKAYKQRLKAAGLIQ